MVELAGIVRKQYVGNFVTDAVPVVATLVLDGHYAEVRKMFIDPSRNGRAMCKLRTVLTLGILGEAGGGGCGLTFGASFSGLSLEHVLSVELHG